ANHVEVVVRDRRIHGRVQQLAHGAAGRGKRRELELGGREEVDPPPGARDRVQDHAGGELRGNRETVAGVAHAVAGNGGVDGEHKRVKASGGGAFDEAVRDLTVAHHVELKPVASV